METEDMLLLAGVAVAGYAVYKVVTDSGVAKTTDAVGNVATSAGGLITDAIGATQETLFGDKDPATPPSASNLKNVPLPWTGFQSYNQLAGSISKVKDSISGLFGGKKNVPATTPVSSPVMTNIGITAEGALFSSAKPLVANVNTKYGAASQTKVRGVPARTTIGASPGKMFSSKASVLSSGASGKYRKW